MKYCSGYTASSTRFLFLESLVESSDAWEKLNFEQTRRECEKRINSFPNFMIAIEDDGAKYDVHFVALFSKNPDAIPVMSVHGWPGKNQATGMIVLTLNRKLS